MRSVVRFDWAEGELGRLLRADMKGFGLTEAVDRKPGDLSGEKDSGTPCVAVECVDIWKNTSGEGGCLVFN